MLVKISTKIYTIVWTTLNLNGCLNGEKVDEGKLTKIFRYEGTKKVPIDVGEAGDIVVVAGLEKANVADTICDLEVNEPIAATPIDPPTMSITITVNT